MAEYLPIRALTRSQQVRIGGQTIGTVHNYYVDINDGKTRKDLQTHSAIGAIIVTGPVSATSGDVVVTSGAVTNQGTSATDMIVTTLDGTLRNRDTGAQITVNSTNTTIATADATNPRIDLIQVNTTSGAVSGKTGTAAASPAAPAPDNGNIAIAQVAVAANTTAITNANITDRRPLG